MGEGFIHDRSKAPSSLSGGVFWIVLLSALLVLGVGQGFGEGKRAGSPLPVQHKKSESLPSPNQVQGNSKVTFYFVDVDLPAVAKFISEITGKNFIFDERVRGKITIIAPSKLSVDEAYSLFTSVLELKGFTIVPSGVDAFKIIPAAEARQRGIVVSTGKIPVNESYIARLVSLQNISSEDALRFLQPFISRDGHISAFGPSNLLLVVDSGLNIEKLLSIIQAIDQPSAREEPELMILRHASPETVARMINEGFSKQRRGFAGRPAGPEAGGVMGAGARAVAEQRLNGVVIIGDRETRESIKSLIVLIDIPSPEAQGRVNVYFLENADATELAKVLEGMLKGIQPAARSAPGAPGAAVTPFEAAAQITITPDKATNSLVIVTSPADYQNLVRVIKQLDRRRKQVFVEAMIVEISQDRLLELGAKWHGTITKDGEPIVSGGFGVMDTTALQSIITGLSGLAIGGLGNFLTLPNFLPTSTSTDGTTTTPTSGITIPGLSFLFGLNEFKGAVNILSTPQILTSDNKEAEILVGENVPFITGRQTNPQLATSVYSTVERQDVGIKLRITPQIAEGDYIKLDIYQEISSVKEESELITLTVGPTTTKRSTKTSVVVKDGQMVVIGGLIEDKRTEGVTKVPLLGDIPILGWLFKYKKVDEGKINLFVFISPHLVREAGAMDRVTEEKKKDLAKEAQQYAEGELLVKFREGISPETAQSLIEQKGATLVRYMETIGIHQIKLKKGQTVDEGQREFARSPEVEYAEPNFQLRIQPEAK